MHFVTLFPGSGGFVSGLIAASCGVGAAVEDDPGAAGMLAENFPSLPIFPSSGATPGRMPYCDGFCVEPPLAEAEGALRVAGSLAKTMQPRVVLAHCPTHDFLYEVKEWLSGMQYYQFVGVLGSERFGVPQDRRTNYVVGLRRDVKMKTLSFPFPEGRDAPPRPIGGFLDSPPSPDMLVGPETLSFIRKRMADSHFGHQKYQILTPKDPCPRIPHRYDKGPHALLVDDGIGPRKLSPDECKRLMGFPDGYSLGGLSRTQAYRILCQGVCPPVVTALAEEVKLWLAP